MVRIWVYDDCLASAVGGFLDVFSTANAVWRGLYPDLPAPFVTRIESLDGGAVRAASGMQISVDGRLSPRTRTAAVLLPGIFCSEGSESLAARLCQLGALHGPLRRQLTAGALLCANCSASFVLGDAGLLDGRRATTTWWLAEAFRERFPTCLLDANAVLSEDQGILCSGATTTYLDLALRVVEQLAGMACASACARLLLIDGDRDSQAPYMTRTLQEQTSHSDALVSRSQRWIQRNLAHPFSLERLAHATASSERTLIRRFQSALRTTPLGYVQTLRVEAAKGLLVSSQLDVQRVAERVGYGDVSSFRRIFKREVGLTPLAYRRRFERARSHGKGTSSIASGKP